MQEIGLIMTFRCLMVAEVTPLVGCRGRSKGLSSLLTRLTVALWFSPQSLMLQIAANWIVQEKKEIAAAKEAYLAEHCPSPSLHGDQAALMVTDAPLLTCLLTCHSEESIVHRPAVVLIGTLLR